MNSTNRRKILTFLTELSRILLALVLLLSGLLKGIDPVGGAIKVGEYFTAFGLTALAPLSLVVSIALCSAEFLLGGLLLMGLWRKFSTLLTLLFMGAMTLLTLYLAIYNPISDCGCFGDAVKISNQATFAKNVLFSVPALILFAGRKRMAPVSPKRPVLYTLSLMLLFGWGLFVWGNLRHLPVADFRPYKRGASLRSLILRPDDAPEPVIDYKFIYERAGVKDTFDINHIPTTEDWEYVDRIEEVIAKGYEPPITDFALFDGEEELTERLLRYPGKMIWVTTTHWPTHKGTIAHKLNALAQEAKEQGVQFYAIAASEPEENLRWRETSAAAYPILFADAVTIETMARANPSVFFLEDGVILDKINALDIQSASKVEAQLQKIFGAPANTSDVHLGRWLLLFLWLVITLVMYFLVVGKEPSPQIESELLPHQTTPSAPQEESELTAKQH